MLYFNRGKSKEVKERGGQFYLNLCQTTIASKIIIAINSYKMETPLFTFVLVKQKPIHRTIFKTI